MPDAGVPSGWADMMGEPASGRKRESLVADIPGMATTRRQRD